MTITYEQLKEVKLVPVLRQIPYETSGQIIKALFDGGIRAVEVTMDTINAAEIIREARNDYSNQLYVGAGTVLTVEQCEEAISSGAQFIVSPSYNKDVVAQCISKNVPVIPGVMTPTEMQTAYEAGAKMVKIFPATAVGASFIKNVKGPLKHIDIMATGGINLNNAADFLAAGATAVGAGSDLLDKEVIANEDWEKLRDIAVNWIAVCR